MNVILKAAAVYWVSGEHDKETEYEQVPQA